MHDFQCPAVFRVMVCLSLFSSKHCMTCICSGLFYCVAIVSLSLLRTWHWTRWSIYGVSWRGPKKGIVNEANVWIMQNYFNVLESYDLFVWAAFSSRVVCCWWWFSFHSWIWWSAAFDQGNMVLREKNYWDCCKHKVIHHMRRMMFLQINCFKICLTHICT